MDAGKDWSADGLRDVVCTCCSQRGAHCWRTRRLGGPFALGAASALIGDALSPGCLRLSACFQL